MWQEATLRLAILILIFVLETHLVEVAMTGFLFALP